MIARDILAGPCAPPSRKPYLIFRLGAVEYALDAASVQEVRPLERLTRIVGTPSWMLGVLDLRGEIVPILDQSARTGGNPAALHVRSTVIVCRRGEQVAGFVADAVLDVIEAECRASEQEDGGRSQAGRVGLVLDGKRGPVAVLDAESLIGMPQAMAEAGGAQIPTVDQGAARIKAAGPGCG